MLHWLILLLASLTLVSCGAADLAAPAESLPEESLPSAAEEEPEEVFEPIFADFFEARREVYRLEDLELPLKYYTPDSYEKYCAVRDEASAAVSKEGADHETAEYWYQKLKAAKDSLEILRGDTPRLYIIKSGGIGWSYESCTALAVNARGEKYRALTDKSCEICLRGNSTSGGEKPPFNVRFTDKVSLFGMEKGRKWCFLANLYDKTMMRNYIAYTLADRMGLPCTSACRIAEVYYNGQYLGNYTVVEPVTDGWNRVDIDPAEKMDFLFELDMNRNDGSYYLKPKYGQRMKVNRPGPEEIDGERRKYLTAFFENLGKGLDTRDMETYSEYLDVDSFVNFYIHSEITKSIDVYDFSTRYFLRDGKLYAGPVWDYDLSMGNVSARCNEDKYFTYCNVRGFGTKSGDSAEGMWMDQYWFHELLKDPAFRDWVRQRFEEVYPLLENLYRENELGESFIDRTLERYGASFRRNYEETAWSETRRYSGLAKDETLPFGEEVEWLRQWLERRIENVAFGLLEMD